jgi:hypothetical protein
LKKPGQLAKKRKHLSLAATFLIYCCYTFAQSKSGLENYSLVGNDHTYSWMPIAHYQAKSGIYTEVRYNYEDRGTISFYAGKTFISGKKRNVTLTPLLGWSAGTFTGISAAFKLEGDFVKYFVSAEMQFSRAIKQNSSSFMFNWTEAGFNLFKNFFAGATIQTTIQTGSNEIQPGILAGFTKGRVSIPVYLFRPFGSKNFFIVGLNYQLEFSGNGR